MTGYATNPAKKTVRLERVLPGPIERVWAFLTEPEKRARWFAGGPMEPRVGGKVALVFQHANITDEPIPERWKDAAAGGTLNSVVTRWEPPHVLAYTWSEGGDPSEVTFELSKQGDDVLLVLTHRNLPTRDEMIDVSGGWQAHVEVLDALLRGTKNNAFWANIIAAEAYYKATYPPDAAG